MLNKNYHLTIDSAIERLARINRKSSVQETRNYFNNKSNEFTVYRVRESEGFFSIITNMYLAGCNEDRIKGLIDDESSCLYHDEIAEYPDSKGRRRNAQFSDDLNKIRKFWETIFVDKRIRIRFPVRFELNMLYDTVSTTWVNEELIWVYNHFYFTHFQECKPEIISAIETGLISNVIDACIAATRPVNIDDFRSMEIFTNYIFKTIQESKIFEDARIGKMMTRDEAIEFAQTGG